MNIDALNSITEHPIIEIQVLCKDLIKSNSLCFFYTKENGHYIETDHSEIVYNNTNPVYIKTFKTYYIFDSHQPIRFEFYYKKSENEQIKNENFLGSFETDVYHLVNNSEQIIQGNLNPEPNFYQDYHSTIILKYCQFKETNTFLHGQIFVRNLKKMKTFSKNNPYIEISKQVNDGKETLFIPVYRSEVKSKCYRCSFKPFLIPFNSICENGNIHQLIKVTCYDHSDKKPPKEIVHCFNSVKEFMNPYRIHEPNEKCISISLKKIEFPTFSDYLKSGVKLNMITAIDFTNSNNSHRIIPNKMNEYQECILSVGSIFSKFLFDSKFPVLGFGCEVIGNNQFGQCFPLTFDLDNKCVNSLDEIISAYKDCSNKIKRSKESKFSPVIYEGRNIANSQSANSRIYSVLVILTEGNICDMKDTINAISEASKSPLSIVIIGIGSGNFNKISILDGDEENILNGFYLKDIVQFVKFSDINKRGKCIFEEQVLEEIPQQIHRYYASNGFILNVNDKEE